MVPVHRSHAGTRQREPERGRRCLAQPARGSRQVPAAGADSSGGADAYGELQQMPRELALEHPQALARARAAGDGAARYVASGHACCRVVSRETSWGGSEVTTERMFAWWAGWVTFTCRLAPFSFEVFALLKALNDGVNESALQPVRGNGLGLGD